MVMEEFAKLNRIRRDCKTLIDTVQSSARCIACDLKVQYLSYGISLKYNQKKYGFGTIVQPSRRSRNNQSYLFIYLIL